MSEGRKSSKFIDLSHTIEEGTITYKGLPAPLMCDYLMREASRTDSDCGHEFQIGKIDMAGNGTYLDTPFYRHPTGRDLSHLSLEKTADIEAIVVRAPYENGPAIESTCFDGMYLNGRAVLIHTGWDRHWRTDAYYEGHPFLTATAARYLAHSGVKLVGIDSHNIDDTKRRTRPVHTILLGAGVPICEHLCNLGVLPSNQFRFTAVPPKVRGFGTFPVRAYACVTSNDYGSSACFARVRIP